MSTVKHNDALPGGMNKCACKACKAFRSERAVAAARHMWSRVENVPEMFARRGQDGLLEKYRREVRVDAEALGVRLSDAQVTRKARLRLTNHMRRIRKLQRHDS